VPVFLAAWGVPTYGEWLVLSAIPTYLALSDLSFSVVAGNSMVMLVAQGRRDEAIILGRRLWSIVTATTGVAVIAAMAIAVAFGGALGSGAAIPASEVRIVLVALFLGVAVSNQYGVLDAWYRADGRYPLSAALRQLGRLLEFGFLMGAVILGAQPGLAAIAFLAGSVAGFGVSWVALRLAVPWSTFRPELPHWQTIRELVAPGLAYMAFPIGTALSLQGFVLVVGAMLGAPAVVLFSTTRTVTRVVTQAISTVGNSVWPELSRSVGANHIAEARTIVRRSVQLTLVLSVASVTALALLGPTLIRIWTHGSVDPPAGLLGLLLLVVLCNSIWYSLSIVLPATNQHRGQAVVFIVGTASALALAVPLTAAFGLEGTAAALLAIDALMVAYVLPKSLRVIDDSPSQFLRALFSVPRVRTQRGAAGTNGGGAIALSASTEHESNGRRL
jgi:O-antigen/teichoic acid export membrane protein